MNTHCLVPMHIRPGIRTHQVWYVGLGLVVAEDLQAVGPGLVVGPDAQQLEHPLLQLHRRGRARLGWMGARQRKTHTTVSEAS
jgi:hypothetical protein